MGHLTVVNSIPVLLEYKMLWTGGGPALFLSYFIFKAVVTTMHCNGEQGWHLYFVTFLGQQNYVDTYLGKQWDILKGHCIAPCDLCNFIDSTPK